MLFSRRNSAANPTSIPNTSTSASPGARAKVELTTRNSLVKIPSGGSPAIATTPRIKSPAKDRMTLGETAHVGDALGALDLGDMTDCKKDCRFGERMHGHVKKTREI